MRYTILKYSGAWRIRVIDKEDLVEAKELSDKMDGCVYDNETLKTVYKSNGYKRKI